MTTTTKKNTKKRTTGKKTFPPLPPSADVVEISGRDYVIAPLDEYSEWYEDQLFASLVEERLRQPNPKIVPFSEIEAALDKKRKGR